MLRVSLLRGAGLRAADINGRSDPYALLSVGDSAGRSAVVNATLNPDWGGQPFTLYVRSLESDVLKVRARRDGGRGGTGALRSFPSLASTQPPD